MILYINLLNTLRSSTVRKLTLKAVLQFRIIEHFVFHGRHSSILWNTVWKI